MKWAVMSEEGRCAVCNTYGGAVGTAAALTREYPEKHFWISQIN